MRYGWSLKNSDWKKLPSDLLYGSIWQYVQLNMTNVDAIPRDAGVYLVCTLVPGRRRSSKVSPNDLFGYLYTSVYVGVSTNLQERFKSHCRSPDELMKKSKECFGDGLDYWFTKLEPSRIGAIEVHLIDCLGPPGNKIRGSLVGKALAPIPAGSGFKIG